MPRTQSLAGWMSGACLIVLMTLGCDEAESRSTSDAGADRAIQAASRGGSSGFTGVFHATGDGTRSVLNLTERDGKLTGMLGAANITALVSGTSARGEVKDVATAARLGTADLTLSGDTLVLHLTAVDPQNGAPLQLPPVAYARGVPPPIDVQLDAQLTGRWRHAWEAGEGNATGAAPELWLVLSPDGSVQHGRSRSSAGDASGITITDDDGGFSGKWRTSDRTLHVMPAGRAQWTPYARYQIDGQKLLLTFNDGSRQAYSRQ